MNIQVTRVETPAERKLVDEFARIAAALPGGGFARQRETAFARFAAQGLPHRRIEEWKYTDLRSRLREMPDAAAVSVEIPASADGVAVTPLAGALDDAALAGRIAERFTGFESPMLDLNEAFLSGGVAVDVADEASPEAPVRSHFASPGGKRGDSAALYTVGKGARVTLVETVSAAGEGAFCGHVAHLDIAEGAEVTFVRHVDAGAGGVHSGGLAVTVGADVKLNLLIVVSSGDIIRTDLGVRLVGEGTDANLRGLHLGGGKRHIDTTMFVDHAVPACTSRELFKSVLDDEARSVFQGKILVRPDAQKTDGKMMAQALMLSDRAEADSKPELEIYADDVQCGHGSTTGRIDDTLLFYLMARGIPRKEAQAMLVAAFVNEVFDGFDEDLAGEFGAVAEAWLKRHTEA